MQINIRWLGVAGYEMEISGKRILIDPYVTRFPYWRFMFGSVKPDPGLVDRYFHGAMQFSFPMHTSIMFLMRRRLPKNGRCPSMVQ